MRLYDLLDGAKIERPENIDNIEITSIVTDSRKAVEGCMFVCIDGFHSDGHEYVKNAVEAGASVVVCEAGRDECVGGAATVKVFNTRRASALLYNSWHGDPAGKLKIIGITGTNGKSSVAHIIKGIFEASCRKCGLIGTVGCYSANGKKLDYTNGDPNANMTTPDPEVLYALLAEMVRDGVEYVIMEATSHASALSKLDAITFDTLVFTNLTRDHLDFHGNMENYLYSKAMLFERCRRAVINADDKYAREILGASRAEENILCSTEGKKADYVASNIFYGGGDDFEFAFKVISEREVFDAKIPFVGRFSPSNSLESIAVAMSYGIGSSEISAVLQTMKGVEGRMERLDTVGAGFSVYIDYAHTPDALKNILISARESLEHKRRKGRLIVLFGCGGDRDRGKRKEMGQIASSLADFVIVTSDNSRSEDPCQIISEIYKGIDKEKEHILIVERESAIRFAVSVAKEGDVIILAGKGHERYEIDKHGRHPFDEREIVRKAISERFG